MAAAVFPLRAPSPSPRATSPSSPSPRVRASASPPLHHSPRFARRHLANSDMKENGTIDPVSPTMNGRALLSEDEFSDASSVRRRARRTSAASINSVTSASSNPRSPTLSTIHANVELTGDELNLPGPAPPPAPSSGMSTAVVIGPDGQPLVRRRRRSSSVKVKPPPGVKPTKAVDWEIPRKAFHSSIGIVTTVLYHMDPPSVRPLITVLSAATVFIFCVDLVRLRYPAFAELWELFVGFLMREEERNKINGVVWYLVGVIFVLAAYPRDVAVVSILILSWADTTASTLGRLWGRYTPPLPPNFPGIKVLKFAPRKSLAGFLAATVTGLFISLGFWIHGSPNWVVLQSTLGYLVTGVVVGLGGAVVEALDLGLDDNLTLPILSGAVIWSWLAVTNLLFKQ